MGVCQRLAGCIADRRDPGRVVHRLDDILRARIFAIACGYEDADDLDALRDDPGFRLALGKLPGSGAGLASQPTMSRWENAPTTRELARLMAEMIGIYCASYPAPPAAVTLDIDDTCDVVHGYQQLSFWNGHHRERCPRSPKKRGPDQLLPVTSRAMAESDPYCRSSNTNPSCATWTEMVLPFQLRTSRVPGLMVGCAGPASFSCSAEARDKPAPAFSCK